MSLEKKHWIRLTRVCNENCVFCLDKEAQDGTDIPYEDLLRRLDEGLSQGATRAIVSGGEPTIHPRFHDIVRAAREKGYRNVQVVTNGQMLGFPDFFRKALEAGLTETTFSIHGHTAQLHDRQTRLPGSFSRAIKALTLALQSPLIVSVDIVLSKMNYRVVREMLQFFFRIGVREFDLLQLIPFSHGWTNIKALYYEAEEGAPFIQKGLAYAERAGIRVWTNRLPVKYMPGFEHYLQNAYKFHDEITGREGAFDQWANEGKPLYCYGPRCSVCFMEEFCGGLVRSREMWHGITQGEVRLADPVPPDALLRDALHRASPNPIVVTGSDSSRARSLLEGLPMDRPLVIEVERGPFDSELLALLSEAPDATLRIQTPEQFELLDHGLPIPFQIAVNAEGHRWMKRAGLVSIPHLSRAFRGFFMPTYLDHEEAEKFGVSLDLFFDRGAFGGPLINIPPCITPESDAKTSWPFDLRMLRPDGTLDPHRYADSFIQHGYFTQGEPCRNCPFSKECPGFHANYIKAFGWPRRSRLNRARMDADPSWTPRPPIPSAAVPLRRTGEADVSMEP